MTDLFVVTPDVSLAEEVPSSVQVAITVIHWPVNGVSRTRCKHALPLSNFLYSTTGSVCYFKPVTNSSRDPCEVFLLCSIVLV